MPQTDFAKSFPTPSNITSPRIPPIIARDPRTIIPAPSLLNPPPSVEQYETATTVAMANAVPAHMRGQLSALVGVGGALGRIAGPASLSNLLAWSLSYSSAKYGWLVDYHLVFVIESIVMVIVVLLGFHALTLASLTTPVE